MQTENDHSANFSLKSFQVIKKQPMEMPSCRSFFDTDIFENIHSKLISVDQLASVNPLQNMSCRFFYYDDKEKL